MMTRRIALLLLLTSLPTAAWAQTSAKLANKNVRISLADGRTITGHVDAQTDGVLTVGGMPYRYDDLRMVEVADGNRDGAVRGFIAGAAAGILLGAAGDDLDPYFDRPAVEHPNRVGITRALVGGAIGALIGAGIDQMHLEYTPTMIFTSATASLSPSVTLHSVGVNGSVRW